MQFQIRDRQHLEGSVTCTTKKTLNSSDKIIIKASCRLFWHLGVCSSCFKGFISRATFSEIIWAGASRQYRSLWRWNARRPQMIIFSTFSYIKRNNFKCTFWILSKTQNNTAITTKVFINRAFKPQVRRSPFYDLFDIYLTSFPWAKSALVNKCIRAMKYRQSRAKIFIKQNCFWEVAFRN